VDVPLRLTRGADTGELQAGLERGGSILLSVQRKEVSGDPLHRDGIGLCSNPKRPPRKTVSPLIGRGADSPRESGDWDSGRPNLELLADPELSPGAIGVDLASGHARAFPRLACPLGK